MNKKLLYWVPTLLLCAMMLMSVGMYVFNYEEIALEFPKLGFPSFVIYPLAILKVLGIIALLTNKSKFLSEWAYAGFFFNFLLAASGHLNAGDGEAVGALAALVFVSMSRYFWNLRST